MKQNNIQLLSNDLETSRVLCYIHYSVIRQLFSNAEVIDMAKAAKTTKTETPQEANARRQRAWRERQRQGAAGMALKTDDPKNGNKQLNTWISADAWFNLRRIRKHCNETAAEVIERLIQQEVYAICDDLTEDEKTYYWIDLVSE